MRKRTFSLSSPVGYYFPDILTSEMLFSVEAKKVSYYDMSREGNIRAPVKVIVEFTARLYSFRVEVSPGRYGWYDTRRLRGDAFQFFKRNLENNLCIEVNTYTVEPSQHVFKVVHDITYVPLGLRERFLDVMYENLKRTLLKEKLKIVQTGGS